MRRFHCLTAAAASRSTTHRVLQLLPVLVCCTVVPVFITTISTIQAFVVFPPPPSITITTTTTTFPHVTYHSDTKEEISFGSYATRDSRRWFRRKSTFRGSSSLEASPSNAANTFNNNINNNEERRKVLLSRTGPHFKVDRMSGTIEFGATANLVTHLPPSTSPPIIIKNENADTTTTTTTTTTSMIDLWLLDENRGLAMSIWDPKLMKDLGNNVYRLQIMTLQFVTITLAPWVDVQMVTTVNGNNNKPEFIVQSIGFDPNIQILPGMRINGNALGIFIEVAGVLRPGTDGTSVTGAMAFQTSGNLPPPLRILPDGILKSASDTINTTIVNFVIQSFQKGAKMNYQQFLQQYEQNKKAKKSEFPMENGTK